MLEGFGQSETSVFLQRPEVVDLFQQLRKEIRSVRRKLKDDPEAWKTVLGKIEANITLLEKGYSFKHMKEVLERMKKINPDSEGKFEKITNYLNKFEELINEK